jgi:hypothetical protein
VHRFAVHREGEIGSLEPGNGAARALASEMYVIRPFEAGSEPPRPLEELARHFAAAAATQCGLPAREVIDLLVHRTTDPEVAAAEFTYRWHFQQPLSVGACSSFVCEGKIVESRDSIEPEARPVAPGFPPA